MSKIDREALVRRHNPEVHELDIWAAQTVGNGEFAFTADVTGLQTFPETYAKEFPLCTTAHWAWHRFPAPNGDSPETIAATMRYTPYETDGGRVVGHLTNRTGQEAAFDYLRQNPHRLHLGRIGFLLHKTDGSPVLPADLTDIHQTMDYWTGLLHSSFRFEGESVSVVTACHPNLDMVSVRVDSRLIADGRLQIGLTFPYGSPEMDMADWNNPERHQTAVTHHDSNSVGLSRQLDADAYAVRVDWQDNASFVENGPHSFILVGENGTERLECWFCFSPQPLEVELPTVAETEIDSAAYWRSFWEEGGVIDLGGSTDERAPILERRIIQSQFLTALHCAGSLPSAETGLLCNSWYGKFHLEMHWWHSVHFAVWGRFSRFRKSLGIYHQILPIARKIAERQGYTGARWPKMIGPDGLDSPSVVGPLLIWQQPHPIYYAELCYQHDPSPEVLQEWAEIVSETAEWMADYVVRDGTGRFILGPPLKTVSENQPPETTRNPAFELSYWRFGLRVAQLWRERMGLDRRTDWDTILESLAPLPTKDGRYLLQEGLSDTYETWNWEHPALVGVFGMLPGDGADAETMRRTVQRVREVWQWDRTWGWDFPMTAMAAARSGEPELAIQALLQPSVKNRALPNGHIYQRPNLPAYLPANGGLLAAVALMAAGWTDGPDHHAPGFPQDGSWTVRWEGLSRWL